MSRGWKLLLAGAAVLSVTGAQAQAAQQPIVGRWLGQYFKGIDFREVSPGSFVGYDEPGGSGPCETASDVDKSGGPDRYFYAQGGGLHYTGRSRWIYLSNCTLYRGGYGETTYDISMADPKRPTMLECSAPPGGGAPTPGQAPTECNTLTWSPQQWAAPRLSQPVLVTRSGGRIPVACPKLSRRCTGTISVVWRRKTLLTGGFAVQPGKTELVRLKLTRAGTQHLHQEPKPHRMRVTFVIRQKGLGNQNVAGQLRCNERAP